MNYILIKIEELLNCFVKIKLHMYKEYFYFLTAYIITWFETVYAFHKLLLGLFSVNCPKPGYIVYPVERIEHIP